jgi:PAS domain S-box-containing protein
VRLLLVEDDRIDRMALERHVLRQGLPYLIDAAESGAEAIRKLRAGRYDAVLLDYMLGDMTGLELLPELGGVPAVFITGMGNEEVAVSALRQGAYEYLVKDPERAYLQMLPAVIRNVLHRRHAEESLRENQRQLSTLMRNLPGMAFRGRPGKEWWLEFASAGCTELTGFSEDYLTAAPERYSELVAAEDQARLGEARAAALAAAGPYEAVYRIRSRGGALKWVWERGVSVSGLNGGNAVLEGFISDITARRETEEALRRAKEEAEEATRLKNKFVSLVVHDLRVPLTTTSLARQLLQEDLRAQLSPRQTDLFKTMGDNGEQMLKMIDHLLLVGRLQSGALRIRPRFIGPDGIRSPLKGLHRLAEQKGVGIAVNIPAGFRIHADPDLFGEVLQNLVTNALKFTAAGGSVTLTAPEAGRPVLAVSDTGVGIAAERLQVLLSAEGPRSTPGTAGERGTGLGLLICKDILKAHGGHLTLESRPGHGTVARFELPEVRPRIAAIALPDGDRDLATGVVAACGGDCECFEATAGAIQQAARRPPHLLLLHAGAGGANLSWLADARRDPALADVPVIALSALPLPRGVPALPDEVLFLPLTPDALREALKRTLACE